jgi:hypothetical protein
MIHDGLGRVGAGEAPPGGSTAEPLKRLRPERGGIRVEPEHDTTAALLYERREPVAEVKSRTPGQKSRATLGAEP